MTRTKTPQNPSNAEKKRIAAAEHNKRYEESKKPKPKPVETPREKARRRRIVSTLLATSVILGMEK